MASGQADPEVSIEDFMYNLRREIEIDCEILYQRAKMIDQVNQSEFRLKYWEEKINELKGGLITTNVDALKELRQRCEVVSAELEEFSKKLE